MFIEQMPSNQMNSCQSATRSLYHSITLDGPPNQAECTHFQSKKYSMSHAFRLKMCSSMSHIIFSSSLFSSWHLENALFLFLFFSFHIENRNKVMKAKIKSTQTTNESCLFLNVYFHFSVMLSILMNFSSEFNEFAFICTC